MNSLRKVKNRVGEKVVTKENYNLEIIKYVNSNNCTVKFDNNHIVYNITYNNFIRGSICNPYHPSVYDVGFYGVGEYVAKIDGKNTIYYDTWKDMIRRCYSKEKRAHHLTYKDVVVCEEWLNFQNFAKWYVANHNETMQGWHLDKDILQKGNRSYSPETCCLVPREINALFISRKNDRGGLPIGVRVCNDKYKATINKYGKSVHLGVFNTMEEAFQAYKTAKERHIKEVAKKWKLSIKGRVYKALINYKIGIDD